MRRRQSVENEIYSKASTVEQNLGMPACRVVTVHKHTNARTSSQRALAYDVRRGPHSIGAHVRDAAAYVCWAVSRAYEPSLLADHVEVLANSLLTIACFDREVRRGGGGVHGVCLWEWG